jgi:hypothetical protein
MQRRKISSAKEGTVNEKNISLKKNLERGRFES